eukprot:6756233-Prymnesium_polylepis.1
MTAVTMVSFPSTGESDIRSNLANELSRWRHTPLPRGRLGSKKGCACTVLSSNIFTPYSIPHIVPQPTMMNIVRTIGDQPHAPNP